MVLRYDVMPDDLCRYFRRVLPRRACRITLRQRRDADYIIYVTPLRRRQLLRHDITLRRCYAAYARMALYSMLCRWR